MLLLIFIGLPNGVYISFVASKLWNWFAVPQFKAAAMTVPMCFGLLVLAELVCYKYNKSESRNLRETCGWLVMRYIVPSFALLNGWIAHRFFAS